MPLSSLQRPGNGGRAGGQAGEWHPRQRPHQPHLRPAWQPHGSLLCIQDREGPERALGWPEATAIPGEGKPSDAQVPTLGPPTPKGSSVRSVSHQPLWSLRELGLEAGQQPCGFGSKRRHVLQFGASAFISLHGHRCTHMCEPAGTHAACKPHMHMPSGLRAQAREGALGSGWPVADFGGQGDRRGWFEKALLWLGCSQLHTFLLAAAWTGTGEATGSGRTSRPMRSLVRYAEPPW